MARINIEDSIYKDFRFMTLIMKTGSVDHALGCLVRAWSLAQDWFLVGDTQGMIPLAEWKKQGISDLLLEVKLAEAHDNLIRVSGSEEQFAWLIQKAAAGAKSGEARRKKSELNGCSTDVNVRSTEGNGDEPLTPTLSPSLSLSQSHDLKSPHTPQGDDVEGLRSAGEKSVEELSQTAKKAKVKLDDVIELYNQILAGVGKLKHCRDVGDKTRREFLNALSAFPTIDHWKVIFEMVRASKKLTGQVETTWLATFSWLAVKENALKVEQGTYDDDFTDVKKKSIEKNLESLELK